ncbi:hypothetical protein [Rickettsia gravesii]|uniref:hypothetical protein n=1 Tax=Rickettsia gravesii TaxID=354585 RepID=UPI0004B386B1|nr:hypothetical protein [Rickettsia gravesii]
MPKLDIKILNQVKKLYNKYLVTKSLVKIVNTTPNIIAPKAFNALQELFNDPIENFKFEAVSVLVEIVKAKPSLVKEALNILKTLIRNANYVKFDTVQCLKSE